MRRSRLLSGAWLVGALVASAAFGTPARAQPVPGESPCVAWADGALSSRWVTLGEDVAVRTVLRWSCPERTRPYHLALVLDAPALVADEGAATARRHLDELVERLGLDVNDHAAVGMVGFGAAAEWLVPLGRDERALHRAVSDLGGPEAVVPAGRGGIAAGVREGLKMLALAEPPAPAGETGGPGRQGLLLMVGTAAPADCRDVGAALAAARSAAVEVTAACLAADCASTCLAGELAHVHAAPEWDIVALAQENLAWSSRLAVSDVDLVDALEPSLVLDPASVDSANATYHPGYHRVRWRWDVRRSPAHEVALVYKVRATRPGEWQVRLAGNGFLLDTLGQSTQVELPQLDLTVSGDPIARLYLPAAGQRQQPLARDKPLGNR